MALPVVADCDVLIYMKKVMCLLFLLAVAVSAQVVMKQEAGKIDITIDGKPFTAFYVGGEAPKPYLHPLTSAGGDRITRLFPMERVDGEVKDHPHHRGLWYTHGDVNGVDFWANEKGPGKTRRGIIEVEKISKVKGGKKNGTIEASFIWKAPEGEALVRESRSMVFYSDPQLRTIDFDVTFTALAESVKFGDTKEGFFAIRLRDELMERKGATLVNASGAKGMKQVWGKASPWNDDYGTINGKTVGVAIFDHPTNPKHPTYWHSRDYGLFAANALGEHDYFNDKTRDGSLTIKKGEKLRFRYRVVIHPGTTEEAGIAKLYDEYTKKVK